MHKNSFYKSVYYRSITAKKILTILLSIMMVGCAGMQRGCSTFNAENFGSDWVVVKEDYQSHITFCWKLPSTSITNESASDGIYWLDPHSGHLVHISGWYDRVQVNHGDWDGAAKLLGVDANKCGDGRYPNET